VRVFLSMSQYLRSCVLRMRALVLRVCVCVQVKVCVCCVVFSPTLPCLCVLVLCAFLRLPVWLITRSPWFTVVNYNHPCCWQFNKNNTIVERLLIEAGASYSLVASW
jgi:hypothetical protein